MTNRIGGETQRLTISSREMAEVAALASEMRATVGRLSREARQMRQELARLKNAAAGPS